MSEAALPTWEGTAGAALACLNPLLSKQNLSSEHHPEANASRAGSHGRMGRGMPSPWGSV